MGNKREHGYHRMILSWGAALWDPRVSNGLGNLLIKAYKRLKKSR